jgi:hypothetical protein
LKQVEELDGQENAENAVSVKKAKQQDDNNENESPRQQCRGVASRPFAVSDVCVVLHEEELLILLKTIPVSVQHVVGFYHQEQRKYYKCHCDDY